MTHMKNSALGVGAALAMSASVLAMSAAVLAMSASMLAMSAAVNSVAAQSTVPTGPPPATPAPVKRRALEIRGQAPAPEVVTVRPREVPNFTHRIIAPTLYDAPPASRTSTTVVILPAPLDVRPAGQPNPTPKP